MKRRIHHNLYHYLFVAGVGFVEDLIASIIGLVLVLISFLIWQLTETSFFRLAVALPLFLLGVSIIIINFSGLFSLLFNEKVSISHCPFCNKI